MEGHCPRPNVEPRLLGTPLSEFDKYSQVIDVIVAFACLTVSQPTTTTAEHCIAAIGLNSYRHEQSSPDLLFHHYQYVPLRLNYGGSCYVKGIAVLHFTVYGCTCTLHVYCTHIYTMIGSGCQEVM